VQLERVQKNKNKIKKQKESKQREKETKEKVFFLWDDVPVLRSDHPAAPLIIFRVYWGILALPLFVPLFQLWNGI
jgi:hypothetical protein